MSKKYISCIFDEVSLSKQYTLPMVSTDLIGSRTILGIDFLRHRETFDAESEKWTLEKQRDRTN